MCPCSSKTSRCIRGGIGSAAAGGSLDYGNITLLVDGYATKDFGDTHSLVLLVDSEQWLAARGPTAHRTRAFRAKTCE
jgi:hypothetical protein